MTRFKTDKNGTFTTRTGTYQRYSLMEYIEELDTWFPRQLPDRRHGSTEVGKEFKKEFKPNDEPFLLIYEADHGYKNYYTINTTYEFSRVIKETSATHTVYHVAKPAKPKTTMAQVEGLEDDIVNVIKAKWRAYRLAEQEFNSFTRIQSLRSKIGQDCFKSIFEYYNECEYHHKYTFETFSKVNK